MEPKSSSHILVWMRFAMPTRHRDQRVGALRHKQSWAPTSLITRIRGPRRISLGLRVLSARVTLDPASERASERASKRASKGASKSAIERERKKERKRESFWELHV